MASGGSRSTNPSDGDLPDHHDISHRFGQLSTKPSEAESSNSSTEPSDGDNISILASKPSTDSNTAPYDINNVLLYSKVEKVGNINVMVSGDKLYCCITGCCFMPSGELVLYDFGNKKIKLLDSSLSLVNSLSIPGGDWDTAVAAIDSNSVIVTLAAKKQVQLIQVLPSLKIARTYDVDAYSNGVAAAAGKIFVLCGGINKKNEIRVYDFEGRELLKRQVINLSGTNSFVFPFYVAVSRLGDKIYVSDRDTHTVSCLSSDGDILFQYRDDNLQRPCGLFVDDKDNVIVCGDNSHTVQVFTSSGDIHKTLLTSKDGISNPICVGVRPDTGTLVVGCWDNEKISVFKKS